MRNFHRDMEQAKADKLARRNRGESIGNYGMRPLTRREGAEVDGADAIEIGIAAIVERVTAWRVAFANELRWIVLEINDPTICNVPF